MQWSLSPAVRLSRSIPASKQLLAPRPLASLAISARRPLPPIVRDRLPAGRLPVNLDLSSFILDNDCYQGARDDCSLGSRLNGLKKETDYTHFWFHLELKDFSFVWPLSICGFVEIWRIHVVKKVTPKCVILYMLYI